MTYNFSKKILILTVFDHFKPSTQNYYKLLTMNYKLFFRKVLFYKKKSFNFAPCFIE